ncbi:MAG: S8 family serine peptidase [Bacilli bacterium]
MKNKKNEIIGILSTLLIFGCLTNVNQVKEYKIGDYIKEENAYFAGKGDKSLSKYRLKKYLSPSDEYYSTQKTYSHSSSMLGDIESVWDSYTGKGTKIAVIDDGFDYEHPDYIRSDGTNAILSESRYYYLDSSYNLLYKNYSSDPTCIKEDWDTDYSEWSTHGTNTSSTAAAAINGVGGVGIAPDADILAIKVDFQLQSVVAAINYAVSQGVDVINMSLGIYSEDFVDGFGEKNGYYTGSVTYFDDACNNAYNNGIIVVAAAGNEATYHKSYPACSSHVIGVGALYKNAPNTLAPFTNYNSSGDTGELNVDILAPGYVYTAGIEGSTSSSYSHSYFGTQGTSFSSPIVAGAACLWKEKNPSGTPDEFLQELQETASDIGSYASSYVPVSKYGSSYSDVGPSNIQAGRLNVCSLLDLDSPHVSVKQSSIDIAIGETKQITLSSSSGVISYSSLDTSIATVSESGLVTGVKAGETTIKVTATKNGESTYVSIPVIIREIVAITSITLSTESVDLEIGDEYDVTDIITTNPIDATKTFLFESTDESVATISDEGVITALKSGETTINIYAVYGTGSASLTLNVSAPQVAASYKKITSTSELSNGDYLIVYEGGNKIFNGNLSSLDVVNNNLSVTITNNSIANNETIEKAKFSIASTSSGYTIKSASSYYIGRETNSNGLDSSKSTQYYNTISFDSSGNAIIQGTYRRLNYNSESGQNRFRYMATSTSSSIQLYKSSNSEVLVPSITSVSLNQNNLEIDLYSSNTASLIATVTGENNPTTTVSWSSTDESVATVDSSGKISALKTGSTTIRATSTLDASKYDECLVTVIDSTPVTLSSISLSGYTTAFAVGSTFEFGGTVTATFSNGSTLDVTSSSSFTGYDMNTLGVQTVTVSYSYLDETKTATYQIIVKSELVDTTSNFTIGWGSATGEEGSYQNFATTSGTVTNIVSFTTAKNSALSDPAYNQSNKELRLYYASNGKGGSITITPLSGNIITSFKITTSTSPAVKYSIDGSSTLLTADNSDSTTTYTPTEQFVCSESLFIQNANTSNSQLRILTIELTYTEPDYSDKIVSELSVSYSGPSVYVGDTFDSTNISVYAIYTLSSKYPNELLTSSDYTLSSIDTSSSGNKTLTVTYTGKYETVSSPNQLTKSIQIEVIEDTVSSIEISVSKSFTPGETISKSDITVKLIYSSGKENTTSDFTFDDDGYMFTYQDSLSGGEVNTIKMSLVYSETTYDFDVSVYRKAAIDYVDTVNLSSSEFSASTISKSSSTSSDSEVTIKDTQFIVTTNAYIFSNCLSFGKNAGSIQNKEAFDGYLTSISVTNKSSSRTDNYIMISKDGSENSWVTYSLEEVSKGGYYFFKIGFDSTSSSYSNISSISYTIKGQDYVNNVTNYIMYEDTENQCNSKLNAAINLLNSMSNEDKNTFWNSEEYVIKCARDRLLAWANNQGVNVSYTDNSFVLKSSNYSLINSNSLLIAYPLLLAVIGTTILVLSTSYVFSKKKKQK